MQPSSHIDPVAEDVLVINDDVALMHADAELDALIDRGLGVALGHRALDSHRATHRLDRAGKLDEDAVTSGLDDPAATGVKI